MDEDVELRRLRERVYGVHGATATPETIARLAELEERERRPSSGAAEEARTRAAVGARNDNGPAGTDRSAAGGNGESPDAERQDAAAPPPRRALRWTLAAVGAVALVGIGMALGASLSTPAASADPASAELPELTFPQTVEDVISADILRDSGIDPASTRYIATVSDFRIYLARPDDGDGRCIATFTSTDNSPWSAGCTSGAQADPAVFGVDDTLTVAIGDPDDATVTGIPIRLSDSVTAYVAP